jgi:hypothetical protein
MYRDGSHVFESAATKKTAGSDTGSGNLFRSERHLQWGRNHNYNYNAMTCAIVNLFRVICRIGNG